MSTKGRTTKHEYKTVGLNEKKQLVRRCIHCPLEQRISQVNRDTSYHLDGKFLYPAPKCVTRLPVSVVVQEVSKQRRRNRQSGRKASVKN
jgi:predicted component of type VI protein secretion system